MKLKGNVKMELAIERHGVRYYVNKNVEDYHLLRKLEAERHLIYATSGATKDLIQAICKEIINRANQDGFRTARTDIAILANNLLYRTQKPVDEHCALRMGAILTYMAFTSEDGSEIEEDPETSGADWLDIKERRAMEDPELYNFFILTGINVIPEYRKLADSSNLTEYFRTRRNELAGLTLPTQS